MKENVRSRLPCLSLTLSLIVGQTLVPVSWWPIFVVLNNFSVKKYIGDLGIEIGNIKNCV